MSSISLESSSWLFDSDFSLIDRINLKKCLDTCIKVKATISEKLILINIQTQTLHLLCYSILAKTYKPFKSYKISSSGLGPGQKTESYKTPLGLHSIYKKIGDGASPYDIFRCNINTNQKAVLNNPDESNIIGRILHLEGMEEGFNKGKYLDSIVDSKERCICIHGTDQIDNLGVPCSNGTIRLSPDDVIDVFNEVREKTLVYIYSDSISESDIPYFDDIIL